MLLDWICVCVVLLCMGLFLGSGFLAGILFVSRDRPLWSIGIVIIYSMGNLLYSCSSLIESMSINGLFLLTWLLKPHENTRVYNLNDTHTKKEHHQQQ